MPRGTYSQTGRMVAHACPDGTLHALSSQDSTTMHQLPASRSRLYRHESWASGPPPSHALASHEKPASTPLGYGPPSAMPHLTSNAVID